VRPSHTRLSDPTTFIYPTGLVGRLESRGLVQRIPDPRDARGFHAALTKEGSE